MARELSPTLETQQKYGLITQPYLLAQIRRKWGGVIRYEWDSLYSGAEEDYLHCAAMPSDGSLIRLRVTSATGALYYQRVTSPDENSDFSAWTDLSIADVIAVASCSYEAKVSQFYANTSKQIYHRESTDSGANWGAWALIGTAEDEHIVSVDAAYKPDGDIGLFFIISWTISDPFDQFFAEVYVLKRTSDVWGTIYKWNQNKPAWTTPTSHSDPYGNWTDDEKAYDDDTATWAYDTVATDEWSTYLELNHSAIQCGKVRFWSNLLNQKEVIVHVYYSGAWHPVYQGTTYKNGDWTDVFIRGSPTITAARYWGLGGALSPKAVLNEFDFGYGALRTNELTGISVYYDGTHFNCIITGKDDNQRPTVWAWQYSGSEVAGFAYFEDPIILIQRESTEPFTYTAPHVRRPDTTRLYFVEQFTQAELQDRIYYSHSPPSATFESGAWLEPVPMNIETEYGVASCKLGSYAWLTNANSVYRALATDDELDISEKLLLIDMNQQPDLRKGKITITIDNTNGAYNSFARLGDELTIGIGYQTSEGNEYSLASSFWITSYRLESPPWYPLRMIFPTGIIGTLVIEAQDAWDFLRRYKTRRPLTWTAGQNSVKELLQFFLARSGLDFEVLSASDAATNFKPEFEVARSTTYHTIVKNLMKMIPDQLIFREAKAILRNPTTAEAVNWIYNNILGTANLVFRGRYGTSAWDPNRAEVWGDTFMKMEAEFPQIQKVRDRLSRVTTPTYPNTTRAGERALSDLRKAEILTGEASWMDAPTNCGLEPWDKLQITDGVGGVTNIYRRVLRIRTHWNAKHWAYHQIITLGAD